MAASSYRDARLVPLALVAVMSVACGQADRTPAVASIGVTLSKTDVPLGSPIDLTYRFEVAPGASIAEDYRVFFHLNRDDGTMIWNDDHEFPEELRTSSWTPGQVIEYTRTRFVPAFSYLGSATLVAGLYRDDVRLPLTGPDPADRESPGRSYKVGTLNLLPRSESIQVIRLSGWHPGEFAADDPTREWQWTQKLATLSLRNPKRDVVLYLEFDARPDVFGGTPQQVTVSVGESPIAMISADSALPRLERISMTAADLGAGEMVEIRIGVDRTFIPARLAEAGTDERELGIRIFHAHVD
jgi:hypothetical protein